MTRSIHQTTSRIVPQALAGWVLILALALVPAVTRAATSLNLGFQEPNSVNEFSRSAFLTWNAQTGCVYKVQSRATLDASTPWVTEEPVLATDATAKWMAPEAMTDTMFYRLLLPQPEIFSVEPAVVAPGVTVDLYVLGQSFATNDVLQINGVTQSNVIYMSSQLVKPVFTPGAPGIYTIQLLRSGQMVSSFSVTCADPLANPELVLQGPPEEPPASPSGVIVKNKGKLKGTINVG